MFKRIWNHLTQHRYDYKNPTVGEFYQYYSCKHCGKASGLTEFQLKHLPPDMVEGCKVRQKKLRRRLWSLVKLFGWILYILGYFAVSLLFRLYIGIHILGSAEYPWQWRLLNFVFSISIMLAIRWCVVVVAPTDKEIEEGIVYGKM